MVISEATQQTKRGPGRLLLPARRSDCHQTVKDETTVTTPIDERIELTRRAPRL
jgi:hypothetical protein